MLDYAAGRIAIPERLVVPLDEGGVMLSMPATASDLAMHKLVNVGPGNGARNLSTIHSQVTAFDALTGVLQFMLDGPTVTGRRTAAVSMLVIRTLAAHAPREVFVSRPRITWKRWRACFRKRASVCSDRAPNVPKRFALRTHRLLRRI